MLPKELTTVTKISKILVAILFVALPFVGFVLGVRYQEVLDLAKSQKEESNLAISRAPTPMPDETANWKTYRNDVYHYSFDYPANLKVEDMHEIEIEPKRSPAVTVHLNQEWAGFSELYGNAFKVFVSREDSNTLEDIALELWQINNEDKNPNISKKIVGKLETTTFQERPSYRFSVTSSVKEAESFGISFSNAFLIDRENIILLIDGKVFAYGIVYPSKSLLADQILATFRFSN